MPGGFMNPKYGELLGHGAENTNEQAPGKGAAHEAGKRVAHDKLPPHIFVHSHAGGHTVHIHHGDGTHEKHEHAHGDAEGIAQHIHTHFGGGSAPESAPADEEYALGER